MGPGDRQSRVQLGQGRRLSQRVCRGKGEDSSHPPCLTPLQGLIPAGFQVASFQIRCTGSQMNWLKIRHIQLRGGIEQLTVAFKRPYVNFLTLNGDPGRGRRGGPGRPFELRQEIQLIAQRPVPSDGHRGRRDPAAPPGWGTPRLQYGAGPAAPGRACHGGRLTVPATVVPYDGPIGL
eukprot:750076-Hanusia_phi.AAC.6